MTSRTLCVAVVLMSATFVCQPVGWCQSEADQEIKQEDRLAVTVSRTEFLWGATYPNVVVVNVKTIDGKPLRGTAIKASVHEGSVKLLGDDEDEAAREQNLSTDENGRVLLSFDLQDAPDPPEEAYFVIDISATVDGEKLEKTVVGHVLSGYQGTFLSDVVASEFFLGLTFSQDYDEAGESEGFGNSAGLARLAIDTMWGYNKTWALHTRIELTGSEIPSEASEETSSKSTDQTIVKYTDSFHGNLSLYYFPGGKLAVYKSTSKAEGKPYDAFRFGLVGRFGIITRDTRGIQGDSVLYFYQAGFSFTHHQTKAASERLDNENVFPVRFAEIKYGRYEEFAGVEDSHRIIFDGGIRLANAAKGAIPFYAGLHVNAGEGVDDIRIFAGFLFQLDKLATFFR